MPNIKAAIKDLRKSKKRAIANTRVKETIRHKLNDILRLKKQNDPTKANDLFKNYQQIIDKAAKNNILSPNAASRKKTYLSKLLRTK